MGEWEVIETERIRRLIESMGWEFRKSEEFEDKVVVTMELKIPLEVRHARMAVEERGGIPT